MKREGEGLGGCREERKPGGDRERERGREIKDMHRTRQKLQTDACFEGKKQSSGMEMLLRQGASDGRGGGTAGQE